MIMPSPLPAFHLANAVKSTPHRLLFARNRPSTIPIAQIFEQIENPVWDGYLAEPVDRDVIRMEEGILEEGWHC